MQAKLRSLFRRFGFDIVTANPPDFAREVAEIIERVRPYTLTSGERINALCEAVRYVTAAKIGGDFVECGVWRGGSAIAALSMLLRLNDTTRQIYLYDTFQGMSE